MQEASITRQKSGVKLVALERLTSSEDGIHLCVKRERILGRPIVETFGRILDVTRKSVEANRGDGLVRTDDDTSDFRRRILRLLRHHVGEIEEPGIPVSLHTSPCR